MNKYSKVFEIMEFIELNESDVVISTNYFNNNIKEAENKLCNLYVPIRFDLHGVMDLLPFDYPIKYPACIISYVGKKRRDQARDEIKSRIKSNQIKYGILVFKRISDENILHIPYIHLVGTKAWINLYLSKCISGINKFFLDDSYDHISSTAALNIPNLTTFLVHDKNELLDKINEIYHILESTYEFKRLSKVNFYDKYQKYKFKYINLKHSNNLLKV